MKFLTLFFAGVLAYTAQVVVSALGGSGQDQFLAADAIGMGVVFGACRKWSIIAIACCLLLLAHYSRTFPRTQVLWLLSFPGLIGLWAGWVIGGALRSSIATRSLGKNRENLSEASAPVTNRHYEPTSTAGTYKMSFSEANETFRKSAYCPQCQTTRKFIPNANGGWDCVKCGY